MKAARRGSERASGRLGTGEVAPRCVYTCTHRDWLLYLAATMQRGSSAFFTRRVEIPSHEKIDRRSDRSCEHAHSPAERHLREIVHVRLAGWKNRRFSPRSIQTEGAKERKQARGWSLTATFKLDGREPRASSSWRFRRFRKMRTLVRIRKQIVEMLEVVRAR